MDALVTRCVTAVIYVVFCEGLVIHYCVIFHCLVQLSCVCTALFSKFIFQKKCPFSGIPPLFFPEKPTNINFPCFFPGK